ncbi:MAG: methanogenesis marker 6 protein [Halobacteriota archaeon]|nr:methanogenesis marker 6 protein [Halobacteriota archaeon]
MNENQTRLIVLSPDSQLTPEVLKGTIMRNYEITVKDTCYGALIQGPEDILKGIVSDLRELDKNGIFSKVRGFPIGDHRICRATRRGGPRPGFHQLDAEFKLLPLIRVALDAIDNKEEISIERKKRERISIEELKNIVEEA